MVEKISNKLEKFKNIAILGFGREGQSTYKFFRSIMPYKKLTVIDKTNVLEKYDYLKEDSNLEIIYGNNYLNDLDNYDYIMKTPGISLYGIYNDNGNISSQLELVLEFYKNQVIGITGTKGKSTTTSLLYEAIKDQYDDCFLLGNIGIPLLDYIDSFTDKSILVIEISVQQLMHVHYSPHIGVFLNLYLDHLNHVGTEVNYYNYKFNIFKYQSSYDYALYNVDDDKLVRETNKRDLLAKKISIGEKSFDNYFKNDLLYINQKEIYDFKRKKIIRGDHNKYNFLFIFKILDILGLDLNKAFNVLENFKGLNHRLQFVGKINNISFFDDAIATIPEAVINGIKSLQDVDTLIIGGSEKNLEYSELIKYINDSTISNVIVQGPVGKRIMDKILKNVYYIDDMKEVIRKALSITKINSSVLLSPAAASFDRYKDFEEKGNVFKEEINKYLV